MDIAVPQSWGPADAYPNALFALATQVVPNHTNTMMDYAIGYNDGRSEDIALLQMTQM